MSKNDVLYWLNLAEYDLETSEAMLKSERYIYVLFTSQQALEKALKAAVVKFAKKFPPRIHDLTRLAEIANLKLEEKQKDFLAKLSFYYLESRYPHEIKDFYSQVDKKLASDYFQKTKEFFEWLKPKLI
jgi:HEPN domain-containing protein